MLTAHRSPDKILDVKTHVQAATPTRPHEHSSLTSSNTSNSTATRSFGVEFFLLLGNENTPVFAGPRSCRWPAGLGSTWVSALDG
jgi:hypothetical protein